MKGRKVSKGTLKKYKKIIDEWFVNGFNGTKAYKKYFKSVKEDTATTNFSKIKSISEIEVYINKKHEKAKIIISTTHEGILQELINWVSSDITETIELTPDELKGLPIEIKRLITKYKSTSRDIYNNKGDVLETIKTITLQFVSKEKAIDMINKHIGFYEVDNRQKAAQINITTTNDEHKEIVEKIIKADK